MALYRVEAKIVARSAGHSAVHKAAYNARAALENERTGDRHDYSRKAGDVLFAGFYAPKDAPEWAQDRAAFWNAVEARENRKDSQLARHFDVALPHELTPEQCRYALQDWVRENFTRKGLAADIAIHRPHEWSDQKNIHAHVLVALRRIEGGEWARDKERTATEAERQAQLETWRESWAHIGNRHLARHGFEPSLDHRSLAEQGIDREPTVHLGKDAAALERQGVQTVVGDLNRKILARRAANENEPARDELAAQRQPAPAPMPEAVTWVDLSAPESKRARERAASNDRDISRAIWELARTDPTLSQIVVVPDQEAVRADLEAGLAALRQERGDLRQQQAQAARSRAQDAAQRAAGPSQAANAPETTHGPENAPPVVFQLSASVQLRGQAQTVSLTPGRARPEAEILPPLRPSPVTTPAQEGPVIDAEPVRDVSLLRRAVDLAKAALAAIGERLERAYAKVREAFTDDRPPEQPRPEARQLPEPQAAAPSRPLPEPAPQRPRLLRDSLAEIQRKIDAERAAETPQQRAERENLDRLRKELSRSGGRTRELGL